MYVAYASGNRRIGDMEDFSRSVFETLFWSSLQSDEERVVFAFKYQLHFGFPDEESGKKLLASFYTTMFADVLNAFDDALTAVDPSKLPQSITIPVTRDGPYFNPDTSPFWVMAAIFEEAENLYSNARLEGGIFSSLEIEGTPNPQKTIEFVDFVRRGPYTYQIPDKYDRSFGQMQRAAHGPRPYVLGQMHPFEIREAEIRVIVSNYRTAYRVRLWLRNCFTDEQDQESMQVGSDVRKYDAVVRHYEGVAARLGGRTQRSMLQYKEYLENRFVGMFGGKRHLFDYITGAMNSQVRHETANHLLVMGEPGTGKTSMAQRMGAFMEREHLIQPRSYAELSRMAMLYWQRLTSDDRQTLLNNIGAVVPHSIMNILNALPDGGDKEKRTAMVLSDVSMARQRGLPNVYVPDDLIGQYTGWTEILTMRAIIANGMLIIDEAYLFSRKDVRDRDTVLGQITATITMQGLSFGSALLGYEEEVIDMLRQSNEGLLSRYSTRIRFGAYTPRELAAIFVLAMIKHNDAVLRLVPRDEIVDDQRLLDVLVPAFMERMLRVFNRYGSRADMDALKSNVFGNGNARAANTLRSKFLQGTPDWMPDGLAGTSEHNNVVWMSHEDAERVIKYVAMSNMHLGTFAVRKQETSGPGRPKIIADPIDDSTLRDRWMFKRTDAERPQVVRPDQVLRVSQWLPAADSRTARDFSASLYLYSSVPEYRGIDQATIADAYEKYSSRSQLQAVPVAPVRLPTQETVFPVPATYARTGQGALLLPAQGQGGLVSMDTTPAPAPDSPPIPSSSPVPGSPAGNLSGDM